MPVDTPETRTLIHLRTGSKICVIVAVCLIAVAIYYYFVPVSVKTTSGGVFQCGSAAHPPTSTFSKNVCQDITHVDLYRTFLFVAMGVLVAALGSWFFGVDRTVEEREVRVYDDEPDDERESDRGERRAARRRSSVEEDAEEDDESDLRSRRGAQRSRRHQGRDRDDDEYLDDHDYDDHDYDERPVRRARRDEDEARRPRRRAAVDTDD